MPSTSNPSLIYPKNLVLLLKSPILMLISLEARRITRLRSEIRGLRIPRRRWNPSRIRAVRIASFVAPKSSTSASFANDIRRFLVVAQTVSTNSSPKPVLGVADALIVF
jgi:hypothetical protein